MDIEFKIDTSELTRILNKLPSEISGKIGMNAYRSAARIVQREARKKAPFDKGRKAGVHLRDAISVKNYWKQLRIFIIGTQSRGPKSAPHSHLVEFGTVKMAARPFLSPAFKENESKIRDKIVESIGRGVLRESRKLAGLGKKGR